MVDIMSLREVIWQVLKSFRDVEPGQNGPWRVQSTPVRTTAHWLNLFAWGYRQTGISAYLEQVRQFADYLTSLDARPFGYAFHHFVAHPSPGNGLIGQAWVMEALITASAILSEARYLDIATELFWQHRFDEARGLWHVLHPDGTVGDVHRTLNQQVWFAAMGAQLGSDEASQRVRQFLDKVERYLRLLKGGLLSMHLDDTAFGVSTALPQVWGRRLRDWLRTMKRRWLGQSTPSFSLLEMSVGYHAFTLYGFALLKEAIPDHPFWRSARLQRAIQWSCSEAYKRALSRNPFAMGYNPAGIEVPYALFVFEPSEASQLTEEVRWWLREQVRRHFNPETGRFDRNTPDVATLTSRIYEATRLPDKWLDLPLDDASCMV